MKIFSHSLMSVLLAATLASGVAHAAVPNPVPAPSQVSDFHKLLPLQGGSNFRDMGGYKTQDGRKVKNGLLFRSGSPASLTKVDEQYLNDMGFKAVFDLRSNEEIDLYPNQWVANSQGKIAYHTMNYSMEDLLKSFAVSATNKEFGSDQMVNGAKNMHKQLKPILQAYFDNLLAGQAPVMFNCSAGKDRTGLTAGLLLSALGVDRETILKDYLLSNAYRRPSMERGNVDLKAKAETNYFAKLMVSYEGRSTHLQTDTLTDKSGKPYLVYTFEAIEAEYGSLEKYFEKELGINKAKMELLRAIYLS
ncbi:MAG: tyrosine-protein phosphatase [Cellvibrio sp.]